MEGFCVLDSHPYGKLPGPLAAPTISPAGLTARAGPQRGGVPAERAEAPVSGCFSLPAETGGSGFGWGQRDKSRILSPFPLMVRGTPDGQYSFSFNMFLGSSALGYNGKIS